MEPLKETLSAQIGELNRDRDHFRPLFRSDEEAELFAMLPLTTEQRKELLTVIVAEKKELDEIERCTGVPNSSDLHRAKCICCCVRYKPAVARPFF